MSASGSADHRRQRMLISMHAGGVPVASSAVSLFLVMRAGNNGRRIFHWTLRPEQRHPLPQRKGNGTDNAHQSERGR
jgi:hypothetical protein